MTDKKLIQHELDKFTSDSKVRIDFTSLGFGVPSYDYVSQSQASTADTWTFKTGGSGGTTVAIITINYVDSTKATISNVAKT